MGIDPGSIHCGYGVLHSDGAILRLICTGRISPPAKNPLSERLRFIFEKLRDIMTETHPAEMAIEKVFNAKNFISALHLGHARAVAMLCASLEGLTVSEYSALEIKKAVSGYGKADKNQVLQMVKAILNIKEDIPFDSSDALAVAICHINSIRFR
ncbi:crossover junction endodeoxyribonuclease RuvC [Candidatus Magnetomonas plexicatena]|nr:crossover junction endodeoxyribonuclease RuvC [Nitrospirales bacterium LBB_01]